MSLLKFVVSIDGSAAGPGLAVEAAVHVVFPIALIRGYVPLEAGCARVPCAGSVGALAIKQGSPKLCAFLQGIWYNFAHFLFFVPNGEFIKKKFSEVLSSAIIIKLN
jgi:hypothetical protein